MSLRRAAVAGTWYPGTAAALRRQVQTYLDQANSGDVVPAHADLRAVVCPHAGLMYSGPVAAYAYRLLQSRSYDSVVLVGPSHYVGFEGASIWPAGLFETPLGNVRIDEELAWAIQSHCAEIVDYQPAHQREHSLEMQLPFLATLAPATPIVPIVMGYQTRATAFAVADAIAGAATGRRVLLIASSDLSHFYDATVAAALDAEVISRVDSLDDDGLMVLLERRADHACGGGPMVAVMRAARTLGAMHARVLRYADSGDVTGDKSSVVGYLAAAMWR